MKIDEKTKWNGTYDVIVLGFGGAGGTAARFAADNGARVLLVDVAPYGHEGSNTRYSAQHVAMAHNKDKITAYYQQLNAPFMMDKEILDVYLNGFIQMPDYFRKYFKIDPFIWSSDYHVGDHLANKKFLCEYPEYQGSETFDFALVHNQDFDAALWQTIRNEVIKRADKIDIWLNSKAEHLIQNSKNGEICGVIISRNHKQYYIHAKQGVVLATGGFENNEEMQQDYLHINKLTPLGTLYNNGDGVKMAAEVGAKMWHMGNYESLGIVPGYVIAEDANERGRQISGWKNVKSGSIFVVGNDGTRFMREDAKYRHGHIAQHGDYLLPHAYNNAWLVFDSKQFKKFIEEKNQHTLKYRQFFQKVVKADLIQELAKKIRVPEENLRKTVLQFNEFARQGNDTQFNRKPESLEEFDMKRPVYAIRLAPVILNTQGGPKHDAQARILDVNEEPIKRLFGAGELGGMCVNHYQGGGNLAECLIFGKIAGENAAKTSMNDMQITISEKIPKINDLLDGNKNDQIELHEHQYLGSSEGGIGGRILVRVTYQDNSIKKIEVLESHETEGIGAIAIKQIPQEMVLKNSTKVDAISGASTTTKALKEAVNQAIKKAKQ
jgi:succinate dehydrogenase/fumarate reductase flavoprotein subunit